MQYGPISTPPPSSHSFPTIAVGWITGLDIRPHRTGLDAASTWLWGLFGVISESQLPWIANHPRAASSHATGKTESTTIAVASLRPVRRFLVATYSQIRTTSITEANFRPMAPHRPNSLITQ